ncbi:alpha/beta hydrolase [Gordonia sp. ABSL1-1]|uniref:alpha/beta hydrolase n=1 Tax=Gordonia sp. ABSL1-1 TaxID=3053923 RepID=UPI00257480EC|nr:alpha/beta hydrolase [Gordonia sp. ABSL1-1]MDL9938531.1 alpha/beta hydrolase [Gordonia sp. ABSL1-1]
MRPTITQLQQWHTDSIGRAAARAGFTAAELEQSLRRSVRATDDATFWFGRTHNASTYRIRAELDHGCEVRNVLQQIADEAADAATDLTYARDHALRLVADARAQGFDVDDHGMVSDPGDEAAPETRSAASAISEALDAVSEIDDRYARRLADLSTDLTAMINGQPDVTVPGGTTLDPDAAVRLLAGMRPDQRRTVLAQMSPADIRRMIQADPRIMGNLDGVPFEHRATANEINIRNAIVEEIRAGRGTGERAQKLRELLTQQPDPWTSDDPHGDHTSERRFIAFASTPNGRFVEMIGNLEPGVRNATVYVPGTGTNLNSSDSNRRSAFELARQTHGPVLLYADGDLPQRLAFDNLGGTIAWSLLDPFHANDHAIDDLRGSAVDPRFAREMAPRLVAFGHELDAEIAAHAPGATTTFIGHSYGGSIVGSAEQLGLRADNVIYASSAGTGVYDGPWVNPDAHRYSLTYPGDPIQYFQSIPENPHGDDPDSAPGVTRLDTGTFTRNGVVVDSGPSAHGGYWDDPQSTAFRNMVKVITGQPPDLYVEREPDIDAEGDARDLARGLLNWAGEHTLGYLPGGHYEFRDTYGVGGVGTLPESWNRTVPR